MFCTFWLVNVLGATAACHFSTIFRHLHFKKWPESVSFLRFWLENVPLATAACNFSTSQLQKVVRARQFFSILTWKCTSRYSGVQFFHIATSKSGPSPSVFLAFWLENVPLATAACNFSTSQLQKVVRPWHVLHILTWKCASRYSGVQFFLCPLQSYLRTRRFSEVTFRPSRHTKHWKTQHFATSLTFRACGSSFFPHLLIFFLAALLFQLSILSEVRLLNFLRQSTTVYYKVLLQYYSVLQSTTAVLLCTAKYYSSTTLYYKVHLFSLGIYSLLASILSWHLFSLGIYSLLASILSWHLFSLGIYSLLASILSWHLFSLGIYSLLASILSWHLFSKHLFSLGIYSLSIYSLLASIL